jgi:parvulin-like peptidyl-prolyl isomerase
LIQVLDHRQGGLQDFEEVRGRIQNQLLSQRSRSVAEDKAKNLAARIRQEELTTDEQLRSLAEEEEVAFQVTPAFSRDDDVPGLGRATPFTEAAFGLEVEETSDAVSVFNRWMILALREIREPRLPELAEVEERVRSDVQQLRGRQLAMERLEAIRTRLASGEDFAAAAEALDLELRESSEFGRGGSIQGLSSSAAVIGAALELEVGEIGGPVWADQGAVLFEVLERKHFAPQELESQTEQIRAALKQEKLTSLMASLIELRRQELEVHYDRQLLQSLGLVDDVQL